MLAVTKLFLLETSHITVVSLSAEQTQLSHAMLLDMQPIANTKETLDPEPGPKFNFFFR